MRNFIFTLLFLSSLSLYAQEQQQREYSFLVVDDPARLYTMRQSNENFLNAYRLGARTLANSLPDTISLGFTKIRLATTMVLIELLSESLLLQPLSHEEGHRSILTAEGIGSISVPFFNKHGAAYVNGVRDAELKNLRDTKLPTYIRLHVAGNESDYALALRSNALLTWEKETTGILWVALVMRKLATTMYYFSKDDFAPSGEPELERDIVGPDVLSAIRHLHRPDMEFERYTRYSDLTDEEKKFHTRVRYRSLINLIDPALLTKTGFTLKNGLKFSFAGGYGMAPFGDFIDEHFWLKAGKLNAHFYLREFENRSTWFPAAGVEFANVPLSMRCMADVTLHGWQQPKKLDFNTVQGQWGGAVDAMLKYKFYSSSKNGLGISLNLGIVAKTQGYLLEEVALGSHVGGRFGVSIWLNK
ncbi:MAG: hypothetical protein LBL94_10285 [Prevotellaceae bacterium]|jgi:hypothetical protein|nr:hypothetical protein [Prevotellaceae bacterium]